VLRNIALSLVLKPIETAVAPQVCVFIEKSLWIQVCFFDRFPIEFSFVWQKSWGRFYRPYSILKGVKQ